MELNYEVYCIEQGDVVQKEYFKKYKDALAFQLAEQGNYDAVSITPMNEKALALMP